VCVDQVNAYYCEWNQGQEIGLTAATRINRPCSLLDLEAGKQFFDLTSPMGNVFLQCTGEFTFLVTKCADMLFWHQELRTCSIERPLEKTGVCRNFPCRNDGTCVDLGSNSFRCECKEGYIGDMCETEIDFCLNRPCRNDGRCVSHPGGYNCVCRDNIVDDSCATGVQNPCGGSNEYLPNNVDSTKYISCALGFGFVKSCAPGLRWDQNTLTCVLIEEVSAPKHNKPSSSYGSYSSAPVVPMNTQQAPVAPSSYGSHSSAPIVPMNTQQAPVAPSSYGSHSSAPIVPMNTQQAPVAKCPNCSNEHSASSSCPIKLWITLISSSCSNEHSASSSCPIKLWIILISSTKTKNVPISSSYSKNDSSTAKIQHCPTATKDPSPVIIRI